MYLNEIDLINSTKTNMYGIYQLKTEEDLLEYLFTDYEALKSAGLNINKDRYEFVCADILENEGLEDIYDRFNLNHPKDYKGRSLSVSDIVVLKKENKLTSHYVDTFGFIEVPEFTKQLLETKDINKKVTENTETDGNKIRIIVKRVGQLPKIEEISNDLHTFQKIVGGYIEFTNSAELPKGTSLICNEEGKLNDSEPNIYWGDHDIIYGDFIIAGMSGGDCRSLTDEEIKKATALINESNASDYIGSPEEFLYCEVITAANEQDESFDDEQEKKDFEM